MKLLVLLFYIHYPSSLRLVSAKCATFILLIIFSLKISAQADQIIVKGNVDKDPNTLVELRVYEDFITPVTSTVGYDRTNENGNFHIEFNGIHTKEYQLIVGNQSKTLHLSPGYEYDITIDKKLEVSSIEFGSKSSTTDVSSDSREINQKDQRINKLLQATLSKLQSIEAMEYEYKTKSAVPVNVEYITNYTAVKTFNKDDMDTLHGSDFQNVIKDNYGSFSDTKQYYDGNIYLLLNSTSSTYITYDCMINPRRCKSLISPFHIRVETLISEAYENDDWDKEIINETEDSISINLAIEGYYYIHGRYSYYQRRHSTQKTHYKLTINRKDYMPITLEGKWAHQKYLTEILNYQELDKFTFDNLLEYVPENFTLSDPTNDKKRIRDLVGTPLYEYRAIDPDGLDTIMINTRNKVTLIELTSIGCGPCHAAIPMLKELKTQTDINLVSIESYSYRKNPKNLLEFSRQKELNYPFLTGIDSELKRLKLYGVPMFVLINLEGVIDDIWLGYSRKTEILLKDRVKKLLKE